MNLYNNNNKKQPLINLKIIIDHPTGLAVPYAPISLDQEAHTENREHWGSRIGLVLAMAGSAVGLGNFLRFPRQAALNGGGAFMIPYFTAFLLLGIPLMWVEWAIGRHGGQFGHGSAPGMFTRMWNHPVTKYLGAIGLAIPLSFVTFYTCVEGWTLAYTALSAIKYYWGVDTFTQMSRFLGEFQGKVDISAGYKFFNGIWVMLGFYFLTLGINLYVLWRGVNKGIEMLAKIAMPLLFIFAVILVFVVISIGTPDPAHPENSTAAGFAFIWNPDFSALLNPTVWLAAAGQIFFTLSIGMGSIITYASYIKKDQDIALTGLATASTNEMAEVVLGGSIAIPIAVAFFGLEATRGIADAGSYDLGFQSMPIIFQRMGDLGPLYAVLWFALLFFAGITSSVATAQPIIAFFEDEFSVHRPWAVSLTGLLMLIGGLPCLIFLKQGFLDEMDFWAGEFGLVVFALIEIVIFAWIFGMDKAWNAITHGADIKVPRVFRFVIKYITPAFLLIILIAWSVISAWPKLICQNKPAGDIPFIIAARVLMLATVAMFLVLTYFAWRRKRNAGGEER
jgi:NSS family neurotransmitter:Na+ symporter